MSRQARHPSRVRVKVCGFTRREDVDRACHLGVDALGFNFYPPSPRHVSHAKANELLLGVTPPVISIGLLVRPIQSSVEELVRKVPGLRCLQLHGLAAPPNRPSRAEASRHRGNTMPPARSSRSRPVARGSKWTGPPHHATTPRHPKKPGWTARPEGWKTSVPKSRWVARERHHDEAVAALWEQRQPAAKQKGSAKSWSPTRTGPAKGAGRHAVAKPRGETAYRWVLP